MSESNKHDKAKELIDKFVANLIELNNGEPIPPKWRKLLSDAIRTADKESTCKKPGPKLDIKKELPIFTEYLRILCDENPCLADDGRGNDYLTYEEEKAPHGTQKELATIFGESESQISKIISRWRSDEGLVLQASIELIKRGLSE